jgi:uncharacterized protein (TIGR03435 family)
MIPSFVATLLLFTVGLAAQTPPAFDVATVKRSAPPNADHIDMNLGTVRNGKLTVTNVTLSDCLKFAYGLVSNDQIAGPDWITSKAILFDVVAQAPPDTPREKVQLMLQTLLAERLRLAAHHEQRESRFLALVVGKNGPKFREAPGVGGNRAMRGHITGSHMTLPALAMLLSRFERQTIVDMTGLQGSFEVNLEWTPQNAPPVDSDTGPSIFTAVQEQLGLKLESRKGPLDVRVVDHADQIPAAN